MEKEVFRFFQMDMKGATMRRRLFATPAIMLKTTWIIPLEVYSALMAQASMFLGTKWRNMLI